MHYFKLPPSMSESEALKIVQSQGFNTIVSLSRNKDGYIMIQAY